MAMVRRGRRVRVRRSVGLWSELYDRLYKPQCSKVFSVTVTVFTGKKAVQLQTNRNTVGLGALGDGVYGDVGGGATKAAAIGSGPADRRSSDGVYLSRCVCVFASLSLVRSLSRSGSRSLAGGGGVGV